MTEAEALEIVMMSVDNAMTAYSIFITMTFAYMTVAYFAGRQLSRFQVFAVSGLYLVGSVAAMLCTHIHVRTWGILKQQIPGGISALEGTPVWNEMMWQLLLSLTAVVGFVVCLYFMYNVRRDTPLRD